MRLFRSLKNILRIKAGKSDVTRWAAEKNLNDRWDDRTKIIARFIRDGDRVIDFGAGKMRLRDLIAKSCRYTPVDIVAREDGMIAADLNQLPLPALEHHDVAVFGGVMEYLHDVPAVVAAVTPIASRIIVSYTILENKPQIMGRRANGFANDYTEAQFRGIFENAGFKEIGREVWGKQILYHFESGAKS